LRKEFAEWTGHNPNVTLSAAVELMKVGHPINRSVRLAEERLEKAKDSGRNRICAISDTPMTWETFDEQLKKAAQIGERLERGVLSQAFLYRVLIFDEEKRKAELRMKGDRNKEKQQSVDLNAATWRARWGYQLARNILSNKNIKDVEKTELNALLNGLLGLDVQLKRSGDPPSPRAALSIALYSNRTYRERR